MANRRMINESIDYILRHLDETLSVKDIAARYHYSEFYFSRVFKAETGESVYAFIKRLKMDQSAIDLKLEKKKPITEIGLDYGYSPSNYSAAFSKHHHRSPAAFRGSASGTHSPNPFLPERLESFMTFEAYDARISLQHLEAIPVIYERLIGNYADLKAIWPRFLETYKDYIDGETRMIERFFDDPAIAASNRCLCDVCITAPAHCTLDNVTTLQGGRFAVYRYEGEIKDIFGALQGVYCVWLPASGFEMRERFGLNIYHSMDQAKGKVVMDLCIPIQ